MSIACGCVAVCIAAFVGVHTIITRPSILILLSIIIIMKHVHINEDGQWYWVDEAEQPCADVYQTAEEANVALLSYMKEQEMYEQLELERAAQIKLGLLKI